MRAHLGEFEQFLLLALLHAKDEAYGVEIRRAIEERTGRTVSPGAVYTALDRLERRKLVSSRLGDPTPQRGGKRKSDYRIEPLGATLLRESQRARARMAGATRPGLKRVRPPRLAVLSMRVLLPPALREAICGDLEEEWNASAHPSRLRFWSLALRSIAACWIDRLRPDQGLRGRARRHRTETVPCSPCYRTCDTDGG